jgi:K+-sensing histidine kinase KdpD
MVKFGGERQGLAMRRWVKVLAGLALCVLLALAVSASQMLHPWRVILPLAFVAILVLLALRYGLLVSVIGAPVAALIFAYFLFPPLHSFQVENSVAKGNLGWMVLAGIVISYLVAPQNPSMRNK